MTTQAFVDPDEIRARFSRAMSDMYKAEVPLYGTLLELVSDINQRTLANNPTLAEQLRQTGEIKRLDQERHGAIRVGTAQELATLRRLFAVMGMYPVGYYDLSEAGVPVHSTAFRAVHEASLQKSPFRVFTSLLRLELIEDEALKQKAAAILAQRIIFTSRALELIARCETKGGLSASDADAFVREALETFRWHGEATVSAKVYQQLHDQHRLIADIVAFKGPHINHLTPRTLDIDAIQQGMPSRGITPKAVIEGPPPRRCPVLLRQTSFKALQEKVTFIDEQGNAVAGSHTARFGEIEQRGVALTPKGRALYDKLLNIARTQAPSESNAQAYMQALTDIFAELPDSYESLRKQGLAYFRYFVTDKDDAVTQDGPRDLDALIQSDYIHYEPLVYEDFLPVSAAGIFQSNLGDQAQTLYTKASSKDRFEQALGASVLDELALYADTQARSLKRCEEQLGIPLS
ncbi:2-oxoadipate dioxygenase/decarboxylase HglS [Pseudomonas luteola]|uniref:2-oxoadipate dioxygenase/decarboxylase n=1 Tax=Pseudomonas luteola TaxID=47886 RepID=A0ABS0FN67_PSELU|nr:VOC family protein [Pseudomonas zeshuii]MBF8641791.1 VOC family protein [Pseudomonas zeshuii]